MTTHESTGTRSRFRAPVQTAAFAVGALFLVVGIAGFIPGVTTHVDMLTWAGHHSGSELFGLFAVSVLHNVVHLVFGIGGVAASRRFDHARTYLIGGGVVYAVLWLYGLLTGHGTTPDFVPLNDADNWLHLGLAVVMTALGALLGRYAIHTGTGAMGTAESASGPYPADRRR
jgi:arginine exporter protein ArgO